MARKLKHIPSDDELKEIIESPIIFLEETLENGYLAVTWETPLQREWKRALSLIKKMIPPNGRRFDKDIKKWIIAPDYIPIYQEFKKQMTNTESTDMTEIDSELELDILCNILGREFRTMTANQRKRALFVYNSIYEDSNTTEKLIECQYCYTTGLWAVYDNANKKWIYSDGHYSKKSPMDIDNRAVERSCNNIISKAKLLNERMSHLDSREVWLPSEKEVFRHAMLEKYHHRCSVCGIAPENTSKLHMHRVVPGKEGGMYNEQNIVIVCVGCHKKVEGLNWEQIEDLHQNGKG